jgi:hypothetical protein
MVSFRRQEESVQIKYNAQQVLCSAEDDRKDQKSTICQPLTVKCEASAILP